MILWFTGISGVGKSLIASFIYKKLKKKIKNIIHIDGDKFREMLKMT
jgi:adenylylsulfate kinase-like enzyme